MSWLSLLAAVAVACSGSIISHVRAEPQSKPYIPFHTDPTEHPFVKHRISWDDDRSDRRRSSIQHFDAVANEANKHKCPLHFSLGVSRRAHHKAQNSNAFAIVRPPVVHPVFPARGPGRQLVHTTLYEHLDLLSPEIASGPEAASSNTVIKEGLIQHQEFPLLFESSSFAYASPIVHDVNGDAIPDAILSDYDGGIYVVGLHQGKDGKRWFHKTQVPRIFVRRTWVEARVNETWKILHPEEAEQQKQVEEGGGGEGEGGDEFASRDPYHSYFEYAHGGYGQQNQVLRGISANVLSVKKDDLSSLQDRRKNKPGPVNTDRGGSEDEGEENNEGEGEHNHDNIEEASQRRRLQEVDAGADEMELDFPRRRLQEVDQEQQRRQEEENRRRQEEENRRRQEEENRRREEEEHRRHEEENRRLEDERRRKEEEEARRRQEEENRRREDEDNRRRQEEEERQRQQQREREERERQEHQERERQQQHEREERERQEQQERERQQQQQREREERERQEQQERERQQQHEREERERQEQREAEERERRAQQERERQQQHEAEERERQQALQREREAQEQPENHEPAEVVENEGGEEEPEGEISEGGEGDYEEGESRSGAGDDEARPYPYDDEYRLTDSESESNSYGDDRYPPPDYGYSGDDMYGATGGYDDYYGRYKSYRDDYYDEKHYVRINPHILATPALAEVPKLYGNEDETEDILFVPVSYYLDEDEYEGHLSYRRFENTDAGDETEVQRGLYVASAIMLYQLNGGDPRWGRQEHLDLSTDHSSPQNATLLGRIPVQSDNTRMGAFALSKPVVADIDGDGKMDVLIGTSMGIVYAFDCAHMTMKNNWPIQMPNAVESPIVVEDVAANTRLETYVSDVGGNVACFDEDANKVWHRDLRAAASDGPSSVRASSPMSLGDVDGDGVLDVVIALQVFNEEKSTDVTIVFAMNAANGRNLDHFPMAFDTPASQQSKPMEGWVHQQLPGLLLVDLHSDQTHIKDYIRRNGTKWLKTNRKQTSSGGGTAPGMHIVLPLGDTLYIIEAGSGCTQTFATGEEMAAMVQVDDVHGTSSLDLVVSTTSGNIITMESSSPYHPLNVWNNGDNRGRLSGPVHGYSASQGIFVHGVSREYRDIFGVFVPVTFEIFDNRPNIRSEADKRVYKVEIRDGTSSKRALWRNTYNQTGVYTERLYIPHGAGYYALLVQMRASNGLIYEDMFHVGYNVNYMDGFGILLWLPLLLAAVTIFLGSSRNIRWDDDDYESGNRNGGGLGILG